MPKCEEAWAGMGKLEGGYGARAVPPVPHAPLQMVVGTGSEPGLERKKGHQQSTELLLEAAREPNAKWECISSLRNTCGVEDTACGRPRQVGEASSEEGWVPGSTRR